jgi:hypothetical protein
MRERAGLPATAPTTTVTDRPEQGVRREVSLPSGTKVKLLDNGKVGLCHSPCATDDTLGSLIEQDFERELSGRDPEAQAFKQAVGDLRQRERAAIDAGDTAARDAIRVEGAQLVRQLEQWRVNLIAERRGMDPEEVSILLEAFEGDHRIMEQFLRFGRNDVDRVLDVLAYAKGDRATLEMLRDVARDMQSHEDPGGRFEHEALRPLALAANMKHFLEAHTAKYFDFAIRDASLTGFWPLGTTRADVEGYVVEAFQKINADRALQPAPGSYNWTTTVVLDNGILVQISVRGRYVRQFFPLQDTSDPDRIDRFALDEVRTIGRLLFGRR